MRASTRLQRASSASPPSCWKRAACALDRRQRAHALPGELERPGRPARDALGLAREHRLVRLHRPGGVVLGRAHDQPVALLAAQVRGHERPLPVQLLAVQDHGQRAVVALALQLVGAAIPHLDRAAAVLAGRDVALEVGVVERVVLDVHRQRALAGPQRHAARQRPAQQHAVALEPEVVVQGASRMALHDEHELLRRLLRVAVERLGRLALAAFGAVFLEIGHRRPEHRTARHDLLRDVAVVSGSRGASTEFTSAASSVMVAARYIQESSTITSAKVP